MKLKRLLFSAVTAIALTATTAIPATTAFAATATERASANYKFLLKTVEENTLTDSRNKVSFYMEEGATGNNDIIVMLVANKPFRGSVSVDYAGDDLSHLSFNKGDFMQCGEVYGLSGITTCRPNVLCGGERLSVTVGSALERNDSVVVKVLVMQKTDESENRFGTDYVGGVYLDNDFINWAYSNSDAGKGSSSSSSTSSDYDDYGDYSDDDDYDDYDDDFTPADGARDSESFNCEISDIKLTGKGEFKASINKDTSAQVDWEVKNAATGNSRTYEDGGSTHEFGNGFVRSDCIYKVRARVGSGEWSDWKTVIPYATIYKPSKSEMTRHSVKLKWSKVEGATGYEIGVLDNPEGSYRKLKATRKTSTTAKINLTSKKQYIIVRPRLGKEMAGLPGYMPWLRVYWEG